LAGKIINKEKDKEVGIFNDRRLLEKAEKELNTEFIPDLYDKTMEAIFDEKYYETAIDGKEIELNKDIDIQLMKD
jgi:type III secretion system FlhB-like substrate exporter